MVWAGETPGIYDSWEECKAQVLNFPGARYKAFKTQEEAVAAFRSDPDEMAILRSIASHRQEIVNYAAIPGIRLDAIAVDGACEGNPGNMEYRGVRVADGKELFHVGPLPDGTNNVGEYLAIVHALAYLDKLGDHSTSIYSDSRTALAWLRARHHNSKLVKTPKNARIHELLARADAWVKTHACLNPVIKWDTENWGEIPADFGRK